MKRSPKLRAVFVFGVLMIATAAWSEEPVPRFEPPRSGLELERPARSGRFFVVAGRRSAVFGYENRPMEAWVYPLKLVDDLRLSFRLHGYPLEIEGVEALAPVPRRPQA